jgi:hypothetical protein
METPSAPLRHATRTGMGSPTRPKRGTSA